MLTCPRHFPLFKLQAFCVCIHHPHLLSSKGVKLSSVLHSCHQGPLLAYRLHPIDCTLSPRYGKAWKTCSSGHLLESSSAQTGNSRADSTSAVINTEQYSTLLCMIFAEQPLHTSGLQTKTGEYFCKRCVLQDRTNICSCSSESHQTSRFFTSGLVHNCIIPCTYSFVALEIEVKHSQIPHVWHLLSGCV